MRREQGELRSADLAAASRGREQLSNLLGGLSYRATDIFNFDETGLWYRALPRRTLATGPVKGSKLEKERLTLALCVNVTGTERLKPMMIGRYKQPHCFDKAFRVSDFVHYSANKTAWMTQELFREYVADVNRTMRLSSRNILLLLDNATSHCLSSDIAETRQIRGVLVAQMSNVLLVYLPANTTSVLQPLDQGTIAVVKQHYKQKLARWHLANTEMAVNDDNTPAPDKVNVRQAIEWSCSAWKDVTDDCIRNCWRKTGILPDSVWQV